jgi:hypothetical protein
MSTAKGASRGGIPPRGRSSARKAAEALGVPALLRGDLGEVAFVHKAMSLGFVVAKPYGHIHRYDFVVEGRTNLWRVQVKTCSCLQKGLYHLAVRRTLNSTKIAYTESELDFVAAYVFPEETWYVLPVREVAGRTTLSLRPKGYPGQDRYAHYREAWHLLREPDGLTFG